MSNLRTKLIQYSIEQIGDRKWHWFQYHFNFYKNQEEHFFAASIINVCLNLEMISSGIGFGFLKRLGSISDRERNMADYDQLMSILAELIVLNHIVTFDWKEKVEFIFEPTNEHSKKNPEINIVLKNFTIGVEVKAPKIIEFSNIRTQKLHQLPARSFLKDLLKPEEVTLPRDNPVKDFLESANSKFASFKKNDINYFGILIIMWDDFIYEPISALLSPMSGLFTDNTFIKDDGNYMFEGIDCIYVTKQLHQLRLLAGDRKYDWKLRHALDYGSKDIYPWKVGIPNQFTKPKLPEIINECFQGNFPDMALGAEYQPTDLINWRTIN